MSDSLDKLELEELKEIATLVEDRAKKDDGVRYSLEEAKEMFDETENNINK